MNNLISHSWLIPLMPLAAFLLNIAFFRRNARAAAAVGVTANIAAALLAIPLARQFFADAKPQLAWSLSWLHIPGIGDVSMGCWLDPISVMMLVVISIISALVHVYSVGYMRGDAGMARFFAFLPFFTFAMMGLVIASNLIQLYVFWELVGLASYLLIGFWYTKPSAVEACKKAFIVTRFADAFFLAGIVIVGTFTHKIDFSDVNTLATAKVLASHNVILGGLTINLLALATVLIFAGGWGKSAMFPLHIWLPDAMEGPTPVSSIIHSATMVVAGVYLTARMFPLFSAAPETLATVEVLGAFTALFAAVIACAQTDIKRILAYSTLSQLGYMLFSLGTTSTANGVVGLGYTASMFHIFTHAFFKCMLFLCAGAMIHAVHSNDLAQMGGLRKKMPLTHWSALAGCLALAGIYPFAGFFSKDMILLSAFSAGHFVTFAAGLTTGGLTAFYMFRMFFLAFYGDPRSDLHHAHEDKWMTAPIVALAIPSVLAGLLAEKFFEEHFAPSPLVNMVEAHHVAWLPFVATAAGVFGIAIAFLRYGRGVPAKVFDAPRIAAVRTVKNKFYIDELWNIFTHWIMFGLVAAPSKWFDKTIVDGSMDATAWISQRVGDIQRRMQNGQVQVYLVAMVAGLILLCIAGGILL
jgi:NADH-quinone oxidoreductase subunit L